jgi:hypothetical protein
MVYIYLKLDTNGKITTQLYNKRDDFNFSIVGFPCLCGGVPTSPACGVYIPQLIELFDMQKIARHTISF